MTLTQAIQEIVRTQGKNRGLGCVSLIDSDGDEYCLNDGRYAGHGILVERYDDDGNLLFGGGPDDLDDIEIVNWSWSCDESGAIYI